MKDIIKKVQLFDHPIESVWGAITKSDEISSWFLKADFKAEKGYQYTFNSNEKDCSPIVGEVLSADPYTLIYTWIVKDAPVKTTVKWFLEKTENGTKLSLEHSGIANYSGEDAIAMFDSFTNGWDNCITGLEKYLTQMVHAR